MKSYDYSQRKGKNKISWDEFHKMCQHLAEKVNEYDFDLIIGIARAGLYPATLIAGMLQKEMIPIRLTRRENDKVVRENPEWIVKLPDSIKGKKILVIDEIADTGSTLNEVITQAKNQETAQIKTAVLITHSWADPKPDYYSLESDELIIFPWDQKILIKGKWQLHPEIREALKENNYD